MYINCAKLMKSWVASEQEIKGWWIFKKRNRVWYVHNDIIKFGPFKSIDEALDMKSSMDKV